MCPPQAIPLIVISNCLPQSKAVEFLGLNSCTHFLGVTQHSPNYNLCLTRQAVENVGGNVVRLSIRNETAHEIKLDIIRLAYHQDPAAATIHSALRSDSLQEVHDLQNNL